MRTKKLLITICILIFAFCNNTFAHSGDTIIVPQETTLTIDSTISPGEWTDAAIITYPECGETVTCYLKHNGVDKLYIAMIIPSALNCYSDHAYLWFDTQHNGGTAPQTDDYYFSCYFIYPFECQGTGSAWNNNTTMLGWNGLSSFDSTGQQTVEFAITFSKLGISAGVNKTLGFMTGNGEIPNTFWHWPNIVFNDYIIPNNWADMIIDFPTAVIENSKQKDEIKVFSNPSVKSTIIQFSNPENEKHTLTIYNTKGQIVQKIENITGTEVKVENRNRDNGLYFFQLQNKRGIAGQGKFIVE